MVSQPLIDRLVCAKYLFDTNSEVLSHGKPYASGMAVLGLQDAAEMVLRVIAEYLHAPVKETTPFNQLMDDIDKQGKGTLSHRTALNQLNKARINFKHLGLEPREADVRKFRGDLVGFFSQACQSFLLLDFDKLSLTALVGHQRTRNWLQRAEGSLENERFGSCVTEAAVALRVFQGNWARGDHAVHDRRIRLRLGGDSRELTSLVREISDAIAKQFEMVHEKLDLVAQGVPYNDFQRFDDITPWVSLSMAGTFHVQRRSHREPHYDDALFCLNFARDLILKVQSTYRSRRFAPAPSEERYRLIRTADLIVYPPSDGDNPEVVETAAEGKEFGGFGVAHDQKGYTALFFQEDCVYVASDAVEPVSALP